MPTSGLIADRDVAFYREHGYLVVTGVLEPAMVESLRRELTGILRAARDVTTHTDVYDLEPGHRPDTPRVRRIKTPHRFFPGFRDLYRNPRLVGIVQRLLGPWKEARRDTSRTERPSLFAAALPADPDAPPEEIVLSGEGPSPPPGRSGLKPFAAGRRVACHLS